MYLVKKQLVIQSMKKMTPYQKVKIIIPQPKMINQSLKWLSIQINHHQVRNTTRPPQCTPATTINQRTRFLDQDINRSCHICLVDYVGSLATSLYRDWIFTRDYFKGYVTVGLMWLYTTLLVIGIGPLIAGRRTIAHIVKSVYRDYIKRVD